MTQRTWVILGATSIISKKFAHLAAQNAHHIYLIGRQEEQLNLIANDIKLRYSVTCDVVVMDMTANPEHILSILKNHAEEIDLFIAHSDFTENHQLTPQTINQLVQTNIQATVLLINAYVNKKQRAHNLIYLSSVAACRGRAKNSLYGASKACIEIYLQGLQQAATEKQHITIARLGFMDTKQTYGLPGIFHAGSPEICAKTCWQAVSKNKHLFYYPFYWRAIMTIISNLPFFIYKKMKF